MNGVKWAREGHDLLSLGLEPPLTDSFLRRAGRRFYGAFKLVVFSGAAIVQWKRWQRVP